MNDIVKYIYADIGSDINMGAREHPILYQWRRHLSTAPKGLLRYYVLKLLQGRPMSGSEIMDAIQESSRGAWRPSPGSVYPLLAELVKLGYLSQTSGGEPGLKYYATTGKGIRHLQEFAGARQELSEKLMPLRWMMVDLWPESSTSFKESLWRLLKVSWKARTQEDDTETLEKVTSILTRAAEEVKSLLDAKNKSEAVETG